MDGERKLTLFVLCSLYLCLMHANELSRLYKILQCTTSCLDSSQCDWVVYLKDSHQCLSLNSLVCNLVSKNTTRIFKRSYYQKTSDGNEIRHSTFKLVDGKHETCSAAVTSCGPPPHFPNMTVEYDAKTSGSTATYLCNEEFSFCGATIKNITFMANGLWPALSSNCVRVKCYPIRGGETILPCPLTTGSAIVVVARPFIDTNDIDALMAIKLLSAEGENAFTLKASFNPNAESGGYVEMHCCIDRRVKIGDGCPFSMFKDFNLTIVKDKEYKLYVDRQPYATFKHGIPQSKVSVFMADKDIEVTYVHFDFSAE